MELKRVITLLIFLLEYNINADDLWDIETKYIQLDGPYCFQFTWLGPKFNKNTKIDNITCNSILKDSKEVPCKHPLLTTNDGSSPNPKDLWDKYKNNREDISCHLSPGDVCVKYSYIYNRNVENITFMCTKVHLDGGGAAAHKCYYQYIKGRTIEVCICESIDGHIPCNQAERFLIGNIFLSSLIFISIFFHLFCFVFDKF